MRSRDIRRFVVVTTTSDGLAIAAKARRLRLSISELMCRGALNYQRANSSHELKRLADAAHLAAERASSRIDSALDYVEASNARIAEMEHIAKKSDKKSSGCQD